MRCELSLVHELDIILRYLINKFAHIKLKTNCVEIIKIPGLVLTGSQPLEKIKDKTHFQSPP